MSRPGEGGTQQPLCRASAAPPKQRAGAATDLDQGMGLPCKWGVSRPGEYGTLRPGREAGRPARGVRSACRQRAGRRRGRAADRREPVRAAGGGQRAGQAARRRG